MTKELEPCPFCGKPGMKNNPKRGWQVGCYLERKCPGHWHRQRVYQDLEAAIAAWNRRSKTYQLGRAVSLGGDGPNRLAEYIDQQMKRCGLDAGKPFMHVWLNSRIRDFLCAEINATIDAVEVADA